MRHLIITITILLVSAIDAYSQSCYNDNRNDGIRFKQNGNYAKAIRCFRVAKSCPDKPRKNDLDAQIASCQRAMSPKPKPQAPKEVKEKPKPTRLAVDGEIDDIDLEATHSGGHKVFKVETPSGKYEVDSDLKWCTVSDKNNSSFRLNVATNNRPRPRTGQVAVVSGTEKVDIFVSQDPFVPEWAPSGTDVNPTGTAAEMPTLIQRLKDGKSYRLAALTSNRRGAVINSDCSFFCTSEVPVPLKDKLNQIQQHGDRLNSIAITGSGYYCITWDKNSWFGKVTDDMKRIIREFASQGDELLNVSISDDGNFTILTDKHVYASRQQDLELIKEAEYKYGDSKCISISTKGICVICEYGICYNNIPMQLANHLKTSKNHPDFLTFTDSGTYFMSNEKGWFEYNIR